MDRVPCVVSCGWLNDELAHIESTEMVILEAIWKPKDKCYEAFLKEHISRARFFDMWAGVQPTPTLTRPLPDTCTFVAQLEQLGVTNKSHVVVYDRGEMKYAARLWLQCRHIGLERVSVLDGGLKHWKQCGYVTESGSAQKPHKEGDLCVNLRPQFCDFERMCEIIRGNLAQIVDTRDKEYFLGDGREPAPSTRRAFTEAGMQPPLNLMRGHMTNARHLFYEHLLDSSTGCLQPEPQLQKIFQEAGVMLSRDIVSTCYNAQTACLVQLAATKLNADISNYFVYTGSWSEFGQIAQSKDVEIGKPKMNEN